MDFVTPDSVLSANSSSSTWPIRCKAAPPEPLIGCFPTHSITQQHKHHLPGPRGERLMRLPLARTDSVGSVITRLPESDDDAVEKPVRHMNPGFHLVKDGEQLSASTKQLKVIRDLFPTCHQIQQRPPFLLVYCKELPPKPWPVTVAGLPLFIAESEETQPWNWGIPTFGPKATISSSLTRWNTPGLEAVHGIFTLLNRFGVKTRRLQWTGVCFLALAAKEPSEDWRKRLPSLINNIMIWYVFEEQDVYDRTARSIIPHGQLCDDTVYEDLRPGVMITSLAEGDTYPDTTTTSGTCLEDPVGEKVITMSSRGFPGGVGDIVHQPDRNGRAIAEITTIIGESDIALAKLNDNVAYSRETFGTTANTAPKFGRILRLDQIYIGEPVYMNSAVHGYCEGIMVLADWIAVADTSHGPLSSPKNKYIPGLSLSFGNGGGQLSDSCAGAVIWNADNNVVAQFGHQSVMTDGLCYSSSLECLVELGFQIAGDQI